MAGMVAHAELTLHHLRHSLPGPHLAKKSKRLCSSIKQTGQLRQLLGVQLGLRSWGWMATQRLFSLCPGSFEPLADGSFAHSQRCGDVFLLPLLLPQFPRSQPTTFFPIMWFLFFLHPSILYCLLLYVKVNNYQDSSHLISKFTP